jgi:salicylate hydroxylase
MTPSYMKDFPVQERVGLVSCEHPHTSFHQSRTKAGRRLQPNGLRVLSLIPGLVEQIQGKSPDRSIHCSSLDGKEDILIDDDISPHSLQERFGFPLIGVRRAEFQKLLIDMAEKHGIEVKWGHQAVEFEQSEDAVEVTFVNGAKDTASFVVGCDGLHSNTRTALFGKEKANFTGLVQVRLVAGGPGAKRLILE